MPVLQTFIIVYLRLYVWINDVLLSGATPESAASIVQEALKPLTFGKPAERICEDLKSKDSSICTLRFGIYLVFSRGCCDTLKWVVWYYEEVRVVL